MEEARTEAAGAEEARDKQVKKAKEQWEGKVRDAEEVVAAYTDQCQRTADVLEALLRTVADGKTLVEIAKAVSAMMNGWADEWVDTRSALEKAFKPRDVPDVMAGIMMATEELARNKTSIDLLNAQVSGLQVSVGVNQAAVWAAEQRGGLKQRLVRSEQRVASLDERIATDKVLIRMAKEAVARAPA